MKPTTKPKQRGGARPGAGRKPRVGPCVPISIKLDQHIYDIWIAEKSRLKMTGPRMMAFLLNR